MDKRPLGVILEEIQQAIRWGQYHPTLQERKFLDSMLIMKQNMRIRLATDRQGGWLRGIHNKVFKTQKAEKDDVQL